MEIKFDQHFLTNEETLKNTIKNAKITTKDIIYEIGPGKGILTKQILKKNPKQLISIEKDENLKPYLEQIKQEHNNFTYEVGDGIANIDKFEFTKLIANIPYSITEPLYKKILNKKIKFVILLHGIDFYKKITNEKNKWHYFINSFYNLKLLEEVEGTNFEPKTKTKSVLLKLELKPLSNLSKFDKFIQDLYERKRRNTQNALKYALVETIKQPKKEIKNYLDTLNIKDKSILLENISNEEFINLVSKIKKEYF